MAFTLEAIGGAGGTTVYDLNDGSTFTLRSASGMGISPLHRITERGPAQDGDTDLGVRLDPRTVTLGLDIHGTSATDLDAQRDAFRTLFKPTKSTPVKLRITRDDGEVRQLDCYTATADFPLVREHRPGNMQRAAVQLRAADPLWYDPTPGDDGVISGTVLSGGWWLANGQIDSANVLTHVESPTQGEAWEDLEVANGNPWTVAFRSGQETPDAVKNAFIARAPGIASTHFFRTNPSGSVYEIRLSGETATSSTTYMAAGTHNYFVQIDSGIGNLHRGTTSLYQDFVATRGLRSNAAGGTQSYWRSGVGGSTDLWDEDLVRAAVYNIALTPTQRAALNDEMTTPGTVPGGTAAQDIAYAGDFSEYPTITIFGPIENPTITNATTGKTLDFSGTIAEGDYYTITTRSGNKTVVDSGGTNRIDTLSADSDLETFRLAPDPVAAGGTNTIELEGAATGSATSFQINYFNRYTSY